MPDVNSRAERQQLEDALAGRAAYPLPGPAIRGRLAQLLLAEPSSTPASRQRALVLLNEGLAAIKPDDPLFPKLLHFKAMATRLGGNASLDEARAGAEAAQMERDAWKRSYDIAPREALFFAEEWADWAWNCENWNESSEACDLAHRALRQIILREILGTARRFDLLAAYAQLGPRGAYSYVKSGRAKEALTLLERVASLLSFVNEQNDDKRRLAVEGHGDLQNQVIQLQQKVIDLREKFGRDRFGNISAAEREAQLQLDAVVFSVRKLPGFSSFALPAGWQDVQKAAAETPLVFIAPTDKGTAIIVVLPGAQKVSQVIVPATCAEIRAAAKDFFQREFRSNQGSSLAALSSLLEWLGGHLMSTVKLMLIDCGIKDGKPITLIPFDVLALLPIHAGLVQLPGPEPHSIRIHYLFHPREISYAYSAHVLAECQRRSKQTRLPQTLIVNNPRPLPAAYDPLIFSDEESAVVSSHFPALELSGLAATTERVLEELPKAGLIHFSCHGDVDRQVNYAGILLLAEGAELNIEHLLHLPSFSPRLVVLSACRSGAVAIGQAQASSLVTGFLAAGAAAVLGTFWHTDELATLLLMSRFYELWADGSQTPVMALGAAQEWLMTTTAEELRSRLRPQVLLDEAAQDLVSAPATTCPYIHPWFWSGFFVAGV